MDTNTLLAIGSIITPIVVAVIGVRGEINVRNNRKIQELEQAAKQKEKEERTKQMNDLKAQLEGLSSQIKSISSDISEIKTHNLDQDMAIEELSQSTRMNGQYIHELARLVTVLSEGMRDQHLDGNITKAINEYRSFESNALGEYLSGKKKRSGMLRADGA